MTVDEHRAHVGDGKARHDRARPVAKTDFAKNLTALLGSGQGAAMAVVLTEIFGPPKSKRPPG